MSQILEVIYGQRTSRSYKQPLPDGIKGNYISIGHALQMVRADAHDKGIEDFVKGHVLRNVAPHDDRAEINACFEFARDAIQWRPDAIDTERIADTRETLRVMWGDCLDKSILLASFLAQLGHTPYLVAIAQTQPPIVVRGGHQFYDLTSPQWIGLDHMYDGVRYKGQHLALDATPNEARPGQETRNRYVVLKIDIF
jgi:hypothetical protein